jgi:carboxypeptidase Taq
MPAAASPYTELTALAREVHLLDSTAELLGWDQETMMPNGGVEHRARQLALLARLSHERTSSVRLGELLAACADSPLDPASRADVRELQRVHDRRTRLPAELVGAIAEATSLAQHRWVEARARSDFEEFRPWLESLVALVREKAACLGTPPGGEPWDALADDFEPGMRAADLDRWSVPLRARLATLVDELAGGRAPDDRFLHQVVPQVRQEAAVRAVAAAMGFDFGRGRLDRSVHPFCSGTFPGDVRITTRFHEDNFVDALLSTMHEAGHGLYEQGLPVEHWGLPRGQAVSLGIHESQSRLWENHVGRSAPFWRWCRGELARHFGDELGKTSAESLFGAANVVRRSLIRVEADEVTYNLHVVVRFELERALLRGDLEPAGLPAAWNERYRELLGIEVPNDRDGCLQDVHWAGGLFGYFPTYTLGTLYAAQLFEAAQRDLVDLDDQIGAGELRALREWLRSHVHAHGMRYPAAELCAKATGSPLSPEPFLRHLEQKLRPLYGLG